MNFGRLLELLGLRRSQQPLREILQTLKREHERLEEAASPPRTWSMRVNGVDCAVLYAHGVYAVIYTPVEHWRWKRGDYLVLHYRSGRSTRYQMVTIVRRAGMQLTECRCAPRGLPERLAVDDQTKWMAQ